MADPTNGSPNPSGSGKREFSQEARLVVAFILMGAVLFLTPLFYKQQKPAQPTKSEPAQKTQPVEQAKQAPETPKAEPKAKAAAAVTPAPPKQAAVPVAEVKKGEKEQLLTVETGLYKVTFSNKGGVVHSWLLKQFKDSAGKPVDLVNAPGVAVAGYPMGLLFDKDKPPVDLNQQLFAVTQSADGLALSFDFSDGHVVAHKAFDFTKDKYLLNVTSDVTLEGKGLPHRLDWRGGFGDSTVPGAASKMRALYFDNAADKLISNEAKAAASGPVQARGDFAFAGMEDTYFAAVFLPPPSGQLEVQTWSDQVKLSADAKPEAHVGVAVGGEGENRLTLFAGPKNLDILESVSPKLTQIVDYGWFSILARPLFISLKWLDDTLIHNWGWSIIVITIVINSLMLPLKFSSMRSMKKMQDLAPLVKAINDKYKGISMRDPKKAQQNEEMMALYKKNGVNPMGGCLPMALQMPFFFAFYKMLAVAIELRGANWLWVTDLSQPEHLAIHVLPITMVVTQVLMGKISPTSPAADASQQRMMTLLMPVMLGIFLYNAQSGLVLYWLTSNVVAILQQVLFNRLIPKQSPIVPEVSAPAKKRKVRT